MMQMSSGKTTKISRHQLKKYKNCNFIIDLLYFIFSEKSQNKLIIMSSPKLIIFDYNDTLVTPFEVPNLPEKANAIKNSKTGLIDKISCGENPETDDLKLLPEVIECFQFIKNQKLLWEECQFGIASTSYTRHTEKCTRASLAIFEIDEKMTLLQFLNRNRYENGKETSQQLQIGRRPPLSCDKSVHIKNIINCSDFNIKEEDILFFDDDTGHVENVGNKMPNVKIVHCPEGLTMERLKYGLSKFGTNFC